MAKMTYEFSGSQFCHCLHLWIPGTSSICYHERAFDFKVEDGELKLKLAYMK